MGVFTVLLFALFYLGASLCYLEDANADCAVCWKTTYADALDTTGVTKMYKCDEMEVKTTWVKGLPTNMVELSDYEVSWDVAVPGLVVNKNYVPHANIHSCVANVGACTPFVSNTPGLSTHTAAAKGNLTKGTDGVFKATFNAKVNLKNDQYTIIAHTRLLVEDGMAKPSKIDVAIGVSRVVSFPEYSSSTSSVVSAAATGAVAFLLVGAVTAAVWKGVFDPEKLLRAIINSPAMAFAGMILGMADVFAFLATVLSMVSHPTAATSDILPACIVILIGASIISVIVLIMDARNFHDKIVLGGKRAHEQVGKVAAKYIRTEMAKKSGTRSKTSQTQQLRKEISEHVMRDAALLEYGKELAVVKWDITMTYCIIGTIFLEQIPLVAISIYLMTIVDEVTIAEPLTLFFSSAVLGANVVRILPFPKFIAREKELLVHFNGDPSKRNSIGASGKVHPVLRSV